jgi:hypothetical protein
VSTTPTTEQPPGLDEDKFTTLADDDSYRNDYAFRTPWADILEPHGWVYLGSDSRGEHWDRPGRTGGGTSRRAALSREKGLLTVFTDSTQFERTSYSKFDAYAVLNHDGDKRAAAQALHDQGFGVLRERDVHGNQIVRCGKYSYTWPADREPLTVGDTVELPSPVSTDGRKAFGDRPRQCKVTHLGTYYSGPLVEIIRLVKHASPHDPDMSGER